ncbi:GlxA family transcriptional regulator [Jannaschia donghaensis]|nr:GlxA family transcriptional regulator [Jannaschia donghaensis]
MLSTITVLETMRIANRLAERDVFAWSTASEDGAPVRSSLDMAFPVDGPLGNPRSGSIILVCGGTDVQATASRQTMAWLRKCISHGVFVGGLCTGSYVLAKAGLLQGRRVTIHWEQSDSFAENFPDVDLSTAPYEIDGGTLSTAGGTAGIDLFLEVLRQSGQSTLAHEVAAQLMYVNIHDLQARSDIRRPSRMKVRNSKVVAAVTRMEASVENVVPIADFADHVGVSVRQLERLFKTYMGGTPTHYYMRLRLDRALRLLLQTDMTLTDVAFATGFQTSSGFARKFRERFGHPPSKLRR